MTQTGRASSVTLASKNATSLNPRTSTIAPVYLPAGLGASRGFGCNRICIH